MKKRRLKTLAKEIERLFPDLKAEIVKGYCNTDRKIGRLRSPGKGREGNRLIVRQRVSGGVVLDHNSAETYRTNEEVEDFIQQECSWRLREIPPAGAKEESK